MRRLGRRARLLALASALALVGCANLPSVTETFVGPAAVFNIQWRFHLTEEPLLEYHPQEFASATSSGTRVFIGSSAGTLYALRPDDGAVLWRHKLGGAIASRPLYAAAESRVFVGGQDGGLYALDARTGAEHWVYRIKAPIESQPVLSDGLLYFTSGENRIYALDAAKGAWKWQYDREAPESFTIRGYAGPLVHAGRVYVGFSDGYLACLSAASGEVVWARSLAGDSTRFVDVDSTPLLHEGAIYAASYSGGVFALEPKDGSVRWRYEVEGAGSVYAEGERIYFSAAKLGLHCLDLAGHLVWRQALAAGGELSPPLVTGGYLLVSASSQGTYIADAVTGRLLEFFAPGHGVTAPPTTDGHRVYFLSNGGYFYALGPSRQEGVLSPRVAHRRF